MDRKAIIVLIISFGVLFLMQPLTNRLFPPIQLPASTNLVSDATNTAAASTNRVSPAPLEAAAIRQAPPSALPPADSDSPEQTVVIENENARYTFTSHGGGLKLIELKKYPATVDCDKTVGAATNALASLNTGAPFPSLSILSGGRPFAGGSFALSRTGSVVHAEQNLTNGLRIVKRFELSTNYLVKASILVENRASEPVSLPAHEVVVGTATPMGQRDESLMMGFEWYNGSKAERITEGWFANRTLGCFPGSPRTLYQGGASNVVWTAVHNQFFTMIAVPRQPAPQILGYHVDLPAPTREELLIDSKAVARPVGYQSSLAYSAQVLQPGQSVTQSFDLYNGPKEYNTLARLEKNLDLVMDFGGFFGSFAKGLLLSMNALHSQGLSYGVAIICITVLIKLLFWPLTNASTKSMKRMAALQPQMKALQEKYKDDPRKMNMKLMEFMKQNKVSPLGGCLPMLLQIPVFFGFYTMLQSAIELRGAQFLWACDLSKSDTIFVIPGLNFPVNPMPLLMGITMIWQARLTPPSPGMDPVQQKIMKYMPLMFMVFLYNFSAGLTLYWTVQNLLTIAQMKLTKSDPTKATPGAAASPAAKPSAPRKNK